MNETVRLENICKIYDDRRVLHDVVLSVAKSERVVIFGPSGCGKSTLLHLIDGFIAPDCGKVVIDGRVVSRPKEIVVQPEHRDVGMVFQDLALWPHMSVRGNIEFGLRAKGVSKKRAKERVEEILKEVELSGFEDKMPDQLSGGERQRVALARSLVLEPKVLLMDEPLSSLDEELNSRVRRVILDLHKKLGFTLIYVTHSKEEAADIGDRVVKMKNGTVISDA